MSLGMESILLPGSRKWLLQMTTGDKKLTGSGRAIDILKERYARGDISKAEFQAIKKDLAN